MAMEWTPASWRGFEARQQPVYPDEGALRRALQELAAYPPLVRAQEAHRLKSALAEAQEGRAFLLQGGDCAESFADFSAGAVARDLSLLNALAERLCAAAGLPVVRVARMAGQFAKPRSRETDARGGRDLPIYRGDIINEIGFDDNARRPDPQRMFRAYAQSAATLGHLRAAAPPVFTGHEALLLPYEEALVRRDGAGWYGSSAPFLWIGDRTRFEGSAHVELLRGLSNPIGIKCGPTLTPDLLLRLLDRLNPMNEAGRITLIARMGAARASEALPPLLRAVREAGRPVLWCCDPMHGNTIRSGTGHKTRAVEQIASEIAIFFALCRAEGAIPGGLHLEMTARAVAECTGGTSAVREADLPEGFKSYCDPRLNSVQALDVVSVAERELARGRSAAAA